ncbi:homoaconitate hydratase [candidate division TA06 bacterium SM1_40]|uniref:3-isopropylmalate dehydratase large subunit n=1 Tax=candidate division TA06 bacterium SM1_40 TaxID=1703773 RepID=A0A0S8JN93_UNCT6|nr:MAG: homoaconitate hydratase [candidate division TA06 bacterium SM1_40]
MGMTIIEKILSRASGGEARAGARVWAPIDLAVVRDFGGPNVVLGFQEFTDHGRVFDPDKVAMTFDYQAPAKDTKVANNQRLCREFAKEQGIDKVFDVNEGIGQHVLLEQGLVAPGSVIVGTDSHMNLLGAVGSFATGMGTTDIVAAWYAGRLWFRVPETLKVTVRGQYKSPVSAKDLTLFFLRSVGTDRANFMSIEFTGDTIERLSLAGRLTLASMVTEINGKIGFIAPEGETLAWLRSRCPGTVEAVMPDPGATYADEMILDVGDLEPQIACPHAPDNVKAVSEVAGAPFDSAFIGSCTNGRFEDLRVAAQIISAGGGIAPGIRLVVVPATKEVAREALAAGLYEIFLSHSVMVTNPGCSLCTIGHHGVLGAGDVLLSTSNRNYLGKLGKGSEVYLASPATVAASCVRGRITDPGEFE